MSGFSLDCLTLPDVVPIVVRQRRVIAVDGGYTGV